MFKKLLQEAIALDKVSLKKGKKNVTVILGRFQPPTAGHVKIIDQAKKHGNNVVIAIVRGKKTDPARQPFKFDLQEKMFKKILPSGGSVIEIGTGFIGEFIDVLRKKGMEPVVLMAGTDRVKTYQTQIKSYTDKLNLDKDFKVDEVKRGDEDVSATKVRNALKADDESTFKKMMPKPLHGFYDELKRKI